jgi:hypothetical protein
VGCAEYDMDNRHAAETTRQAALSLGVEADHGEIVAWAHEMRATVGANSMAEHPAEEVIEANTDFDGRERAPMRMAEARITFGVVRAREGDLDQLTSLANAS